jgi:hypothetical protein
VRARWNTIREDQGSKASEIQRNKLISMNCYVLIQVINDTDSIESKAHQNPDITSKSTENSLYSGTTNLIANPPDQPVARIPTREEIKARLSVSPGTSLFYSGTRPGVTYRLKAKDWREKHMPSLRVLEEAWNSIENNAPLSEKWLSYYGRAGDAPLDEKKAFWENASGACADLAVGIVYVLLDPEVTAPDWAHPSRIWTRVEWPTLTSNPNVTKVIRVNTDTYEQIVIHERVY